MRSWPRKLEGVDAAQFARDHRGLQRRGRAPTSPFNPNVKDGRGTTGLAVPKSNWANPLDTPPFEAYAVTCGITFTFGGLRDRPPRREVLDTDGSADPGPLRGGRDGRAASSTSTTRAARA